MESAPDSEMQKDGVSSFKHDLIYSFDAMEERLGSRMEILWYVMFSSFAFHLSDLL